jgi:hypothetical protein
MRRTAGAEEEGEKEKEAETAEGSDDEDEDEDEGEDYAGSDAAFEVGLDQRGLGDPIEQVGIGYSYLQCQLPLDSVAG